MRLVPVRGQGARPEHESRRDAASIELIASMVLCYLDTLSLDDKRRVLDRAHSLLNAK